MLIDFGAIGYFAKMAAEAGCVGQVMLSSGGNMPPTFGGEPRLGTNPVAWAAPAGAETPLMLDMATTQVAGNKLSLAARLGVPLPATWITEPDGANCNINGIFFRDLLLELQTECRQNYP